MIHLADLNEVLVLDAVKQQLSAYTKPPLTPEELAARLQASGLAEFAALLESRVSLLR